MVAVRFCPNDGTPLSAPLAPDVDEITGRTLGDRFRVGPRLGTGPVTTVYRAVDLELGEEVAVERLDPLLDPEVVERALREAALAGELGHPQLQPVLATGFDGDAGWLARPYHPSGPVPAPSPVAEALRAGAAVASAVAALHAAGLRHLDLRRENVLLDPGGVRLAGAGTWHLLDLDRAPPHVPGICRAGVDHLAPEAFSGAPLDEATDTYLIGALLYELLTGARPFAGGSFLETARLHLEARPPPLAPHFSDAIELIVWRCLEKHPAHRFPSAEALAAALEVVADDPTGDLDALERLYTALGDGVGLVGVLGRRVQRAADPVWRGALLLRIAETFEHELGDRQGAARAYQAVLQDQPDHPDALEALDRLYEDGEQWPELVDLLQRRIAQARDAGDRVELLLRLATLSEQGTGDLQGAFEALLEAFALCRDDERLGGDLERLATRTDGRSTLLAAYESAAEALGDHPDALPLHLRAAAWAAEAPDGAARAAWHYQRALTIDPDHATAWTELEDLLRAAGDWESLVATLAHKAEVVLDTDERIAALNEQVTLLEDVLGRPGEAIEVRERRLALEPDFLPNLRALEQAYSDQARWRDVLDLLAREADLVDGADRVEIHLRAGRIWQADLREPARAVEAYEAALGVDPECVVAMQALEALYPALARTGELAALYRRMLPLLADPDERLRVQHRLAGLLDERIAAWPGDTDARRELEETTRSLFDAAPQDAALVARLVEIYRPDERWPELAEIYADHLAAVADTPAERTARLTLARLRRNQLLDPAGALDALAPFHAADLEVSRLVTELCVELGRSAEAAALLADDRRWPDEPDVHLERAWRTARLHLDGARDAPAAEAALRRVLALAPDHGPALNALADLQIAREAWRDAAATLAQLTTATPDSAERARHEVRQGVLFERRLRDRDAAIEHYRRALDLDPDLPDAAGPLARLYVDAGRWAEAREMYDRLLSLAADRDPHVRLVLHARLAECHEALGDADAALEHYRQSAELDGADLTALRGLSRHLLRTGDWKRLLNACQALLVHHREALPPAELIELSYRQGVARAELGEPRKALDFFEKVLRDDPEHEGALRRLEALHAERRDWPRVVEYRRRLAARLPTAEERRDALIRIGDLLLEAQGDAEGARGAYAEALTEAPDDPVVLDRLIAIHRRRGDWLRVAEVLRRRVETATRPTDRARHAFALATVLRDEVRDDEAALEAFDVVLEHDPRQVEALQAIDDILSRLGEPERQDVFYRRMLQRALEHHLGPELIVNLGRALGRINVQLGRPVEAIKAYKVVLNSAPDDAESHRAIATLYAGRDQLDKAIRHHYHRLTLDPRAHDAYHALRTLFLRAGRRDAAWCISQALVHLGVADDEARAFYEEYRPRGFVTARRPLEGEHWALLTEQAKDPALDDLFARVFPFAVSRFTRTPEELGIDLERDRIDPTAVTPFNQQLAYVARTTRLDALECYRAPAGQHGLRAVYLPPAAILVGGDLFTGQTLRTLAFQCARQLYLMASQHLLAVLPEHPDERERRLADLLTAARHRLDATRPAPADRVLELALSAVPDEELPILAGLIAASAADIPAWLAALDHSADRLAFLLCNDLDTALRCIEEQPPFSRATPARRTEALLRFIVSERYFALRDAIGTTIDESA